MAWNTNLKENLILVLISIVLWFLLAPVLTAKFTLGLQLFTFIPMIFATFIVYKIIEKIFHLQKIKIWLIFVLGFAGWLLSWWIFGILPECGSTYLGWGSRSIECKCKGIPVTIDTSVAYDAYGTHTVCLGAGKSYLGNPQNEILLEACRRNSCPESMSFNVDSDYLENETINCKTGVILEKIYTLDNKGKC